MEFRGAHAFRRGFAMSYLAAGGQENDLKKLGGWSSYQMVSRYARGNAGERAVKAHKALSPGDRLNTVNHVIRRTIETSAKSLRSFFISPCCYGGRATPHQGLADAGQTEMNAGNNFLEIQPRCLARWHAATPW